MSAKVDVHPLSSKDERIAAYVKTARRLNQSMVRKQLINGWKDMDARYQRNLAMFGARVTKRGMPGREPPHHYVLANIGGVK